MDLTTLTVAQLRELQQQIPAEIKRRESQEKTNVLNELKELAKAKGYSLDELLGAREVKAKASTGKVKVKYQHPGNSDLQWTGRGRQPKWVGEWLASGNTLDALLV